MLGTGSFVGCGVVGDGAPSHMVNIVLLHRIIVGHEVVVGCGVVVGHGVIVACCHCPESQLG